MKNKKTLYFLIPAVALIWGLIAFKIFTYSDETEFIENVQIVSSNKTYTIETDTFELSLDYPDPFLKSTNTVKYYKTKNSQTKQKQNNRTNRGTTKNNQSQNQQEHKNTEIKWPQIKYDGLITNNSSGTVTGVLIINGETKLIQPGTIINGISIQDLSEQEVVLKLQNDIKSFYKGN